MIKHLSTFDWKDGRKSKNDYIRDYLQTNHVPYYNTMNGDVLVQACGAWRKIVAQHKEKDIYYIGVLVEV